MKLIAGVDEVGRGSLIGPVYAAAVILKKSADLEILKDSKLLSKKKREYLFNYIKKNSIWSLGKASVSEIEKLNILNASLLAMKRAILKLTKKPNLVLIDGNKSPEDLSAKCKTIVNGDSKSLSIAAASIVAKITRDRIMSRLDKEFPGYDWSKNAGYPTKFHKSAILNIGITPHHRRSFKPVHNILYPENI